MRRNILLIILFSIFSTLLLACSASPDPAATVSAYLNALVAKDANRLSVLSCPDWAAQSQQLLDSITSVEVKLSDLSCQQTESDGSKASVKCSGKITATYNNENQELDLSTSTYLLVKQNDEWLVCGQK